jgi:hypothetical protein
MIFGGLISIIVWVALAVGVLYGYFGYLPTLYKEQGNAPEYVQPLGLGEWYKVGLSVDEWKDASTKGYEAAVAESQDFIKSVPGGKESLEVAQKVRYTAVFS